MRYAFHACPRAARLLRRHDRFDSMSRVKDPNNKQSQIERAYRQTNEGVTRMPQRFGKIACSMAYFKGTAQDNIERLHVLGSKEPQIQ